MKKEVVSSVDGMTNVEPIPMTHKEAHKLDVLMEVTFKYIQNSCYKEG